MKINILILSCGTRNKIVQYFKENLKGKGNVIAADCSELAPALYEADRYYILPRITEAGYIEKVLELCKKEKVTGVLSLIDPELSLLAKHTTDFEKNGTTVIGSSYELCERALNKWDMFRWLKGHGFLCAETFLDIETFSNAYEAHQIQFPVILKPVCGSASQKISVVHDMETLKNEWRESEQRMIQEFLKGQEIGVDCYIDLISHEVVSVFAKKKIQMRAGETDKSVSFKDEKLFQLICRFVKESGYRGQIDIDLFCKNGNYYISEVNPRFGGGYPHAYLCGKNHMELIINNLSGERNEPKLGDYKEGIFAMKFNEIMTKVE